AWNLSVRPDRGRPRNRRTSSARLPGRRGTMSTSSSDFERHDPPTPDDLAGTPVCKEDDDSTTRVRGARGAKARGRSGKRTRGAPPAPVPQGPPTADELAGVPVSVEDEGPPRTGSRKPRRGR